MYNTFVYTMSFQPWQLKELQEMHKEERAEYAEWYDAISSQLQNDEVYPHTKKRPATTQLTQARSKYPRLDRPRDKSI